jgi:hypothetical protein
MKKLSNIDADNKLAKTATNPYGDGQEPLPLYRFSMQSDRKLRRVKRRRTDKRKHGHSNSVSL